jgi:peptidyl-prolyl cis-trans isomerase B (cyclophilin B)
VSKANKRERQRMNREARREYEEALAKRRRLFKTLRTFAIIAVPILAIGIVLSISNSGDDNGKATGAGACADVKTPPAKDVQPTAPPLGIDTNQAYTATLDTTCGTIEVALDAQQYPVNVNNFVALANQGYYDGLAFARAAKDFVIQGGAATQSNDAPAPYTQQGEVPTATPAYPVGTLAMAKTGSDPAGTISTQYFIVTGKNGKSLPADYAVVGHVTKGIDVAKTIAGFAPASGDGPLTKPVVVKKLTITTKGIVPPSTAPGATTTPSS